MSAPGEGWGPPRVRASWILGALGGALVVVGVAFGGALQRAHQRPSAEVQLAPSLAEMREALALADQLAGQAEALLSEIAILQNRWAETVLLPASKTPCADVALVDDARRTDELGPQLRDAAQATRVQVERAAWMVERPTTEPLVSEAERAQAASLRDRADVLAAGYEATAAWQRQHLTRVLSKCPVAEATDPPTPASGELR